MKWPLASAIAAAALVSAAGFWWTAQDANEAQAAFIGEPLPAFGDASFAEARRQANTGVSHKRQLLTSAPDQWLRREVLALALMDRFRLTGDFADLDEARELLDSGIKLAPSPSGPNLSRAILALTEHDLNRSEQALDRFQLAAVKSPADQADAAAMRGDIAFQRGDRSAAVSAYRRADGLSPTLGTKLRLAEIELRTGNPRGAIAITEQALHEYPASPGEFARVALLLANQSYAAGDLDLAGRWIDRADRAFPGFWLAQAYRAQHLAVEGDVAGSIAALKKLARESDEPEVLDALSGILSETGNEREAAKWSARAAALWEKKVARSPSSYRLHAAEHFLDFGDPARALELVREEVAIRPTPNAVEVMASSLTANGRPQEALEWLDRARDAGWDMTSLRLSRANALEALGHEDKAREVLRQAAQGASLADDPKRPLVRFGHY